MATSSSPVTSMPFGYSFDQPSSFAYPSPPVPAPGPSLLDDHETNLFDNFLTNVDAGNFNFPHFSSQKNSNINGANDGLYSEGLPPAFYGFSANIPPQIIPSESQPNFSLDGSMGQENRQSLLSADVVAAANTLLQNGNSSELQRATLNSSHLANESNGFLAQPDDFLKFSALHNSEMRPPPSKSVQRHSISHTIDDPLMHSIMFGNEAPPASISRRKTMDFNYGTDVSFLSNGYAPPPGQETEEQMTKDLMQKMECLERQHSANNTQPSTPKVASSQKFSDSKISQRRSQELVLGDENEGNARPRKRRKSTFAKEEPSIESNDEPEKEASIKARKTHTSSLSVDIKGKRVSAIELSPSKRRRSISHSQRENLTEDQKRNNHILSEQKRRNLIKQGFEDLCEIVPELNDGNFSKSAMLTVAAEWLSSMLSDNEKLRTMLKELDDVDME